ncbi:MAG: hypothetical protein K2F53_04220 [Rikenellaceae bacterium]|nr:hypothetical protein [Rikenellaceae bacterium]MDE7134260.1 hypothetical protein [Rikenellaceae bacterium]MDE7356026.1 hypothetical protein [Rikenellaceae bacterium]
MKSNKDFRERHHSSDDLLKKPTRLEPNRKSGKERIIIDDDYDEDELYQPKRESILDYFDNDDE